MIYFKHTTSATTLKGTKKPKVYFKECIHIHQTKPESVTVSKNQILWIFLKRKFISPEMDHPRHRHSRFASPMTPQTSKTNSSGNAKSPRVSSSATANSSGLPLSFPASNIVVAKSIS